MFMFVSILLRYGQSVQLCRCSSKYLGKVREFDVDWKVVTVWNRSRVSSVTTAVRAVRVVTVT